MLAHSQGVKRRKLPHNALLTNAVSNYYDILGVAKTATPEELKAAFRKLAKTHHPDVGGDPEKFKEINEAYDCLSDPQSRAAYDRGGQRAANHQNFHHDPDPKLNK